LATQPLTNQQIQEIDEVRDEIRDKVDELHQTNGVIDGLIASIIAVNVALNAEQAKANPSPEVINVLQNLYNTLAQKIANAQAKQVHLKGEIEALHEKIEIIETTQPLPGNAAANHPPKQGHTRLRAPNGMPTSEYIARLIVPKIIPPMATRT